MWPLTKDLPKSLLPIGNKPALDYVFDRLLEANLNSITILTNLKFKPHFEAWLKEKRTDLVEILAEPSRREEEKLGAIGALVTLTPRLEQDDYLIMAGDNIITAGVKGMIDFYEEKRAPVMAIIKAKRTEEVLRGSSVLLTEDGRILWFEEKPREVKSMMIGACIYILPYGTLLRTSEYLREDGNRDEPGGFMEWLCKREVVYGYMLPGQLWDIGTIENYEQLKQEFARLVPGYSSTPETTCTTSTSASDNPRDEARSSTDLRILSTSSLLQST